jgi:hypothetical protein
MERPGCVVAAIGMVGFIVAGIAIRSWVLIYFGIFFPVIVWLANDSS